VFLTRIPESLEKAVRIDSSLKRRAERNAAPQDVHSTKIGRPNAGIVKPTAHSDELIRNRLNHQPA
jgi:hypothetical protein